VLLQLASSLPTDDVWLRLLQPDTSRDLLAAFVFDSASLDPWPWMSALLQAPRWPRRPVLLRLASSLPADDVWLRLRQLDILRHLPVAFVLDGVSTAPWPWMSAPPETAPRWHWTLVLLQLASPLPADDVWLRLRQLDTSWRLPVAFVLDNASFGLCHLVRV
jgi:hypothetical protein